MHADDVDLTIQTQSVQDIDASVRAMKEAMEQAANAAADRARRKREKNRNPNRRYHLTTVTCFITRLCIYRTYQSPPRKKPSRNKPSQQA